MQIFVKSECDYVGVEMSVGMFATPLTLSAAALSWIPWLNFNRCSTMRIRQGDLAVLFHCVVRYACIMRTSLCTFVFVFYALCEDTVGSFTHASSFIQMHVSFCVFACVPICYVCVRACNERRRVCCSIQ